MCWIFDCLERRSIVAMAGGQRLVDERCKMRDKGLYAALFHMFMFWKNEVLQDIDAVVEAI
jgi:very-short-patch-repair endonuclease